MVQQSNDGHKDFEICSCPDFSLVAIGWFSHVALCLYVLFLVPLIYLASVAWPFIGFV